MDKQLYFYEVSADYITYLLRFDSKVPRVDYSADTKHNKFLCGEKLLRFQETRNRLR